MTEILEETDSQVPKNLKKRKKMTTKESGRNSKN